MSTNTKIGWTDATWNPTTGCTKVSQGCKHCYAEREWKRLAANPRGGVYQGREFTDVRCHPERLDQPLKWRKPRRVFVNSMSDLFHENVPDEFIDQVFAVMALAPPHIFQVLTKRPRRMWEYMIGQHDIDGLDDVTRVECIRFAAQDYTCTPDEDVRWPPPNIHLGVSCEDQASANERIPLLLKTPAAVRWVSLEPLLGPVDIRRWITDAATETAQRGDPLAATLMRQSVAEGSGWMAPTLDWFVVGGESGPKARPCCVEWIRDVIDQCHEAWVPVFVKQLGARPVRWVQAPSADGYGDYGPEDVKLSNRAGSDPSEWPEDLRVQEYPA